ncbi:MAG TPA: LLM class flavin-dependent oxidoreductase [Methylovirgula sp.]|jgi:5,10-methylenetetrahydromethanopterin reductase|nr:LLM class flavin-dependent oxidoreductase [Methylovirgula sp.]
MRLGIYFDGFSSASEIMDVAHQAEKAGAESLWFAQHMGYREAMMMAAAVAGITKSSKLVPTAITPYLWPSLPTAMSLATLNELAPGRAQIAVSVGNVLNLGESGVEAVKPVRVIREYVENVRALLSGEAVRRDGEVENLRGAHMEFGKGIDVPIYVASTGPKVMQLAGQIGDGILLSAGLTHAHTRRCLEAVEAGAREAGRDPNSVRKAGFINLNISKDGAAARAALLRKLAFLFRSRGHSENIKSSELDIDHQAIIEALSRRDLDGAARLLPEAAATTFGVAGTPAECRQQLEAYLAIGLTEPIIEVTGSKEERQLALDLMRELAGL